MMRLTADDLKKDVDMLLDDLKRNYEIPSVLNSVRFLSKVIAIALVVQFFLSALDFFIWGGEYKGGAGKRLLFIALAF
ncbi:hypothetical protein [Salmonella enterica]|uniref:hypothetical protein n=1 Tax=Salmonella enterica TaxID=28901 RepID=UPI0010718CFD|nr:hypothetical protein [Salmonella enterica]